MSKHSPAPWSRVKPLGSAYWTLGRIRDHRAEPLPRMNEHADWTLAEAAPDLYEIGERMRMNLMSTLNSHVAEPFHPILNVWAVISGDSLLGAWTDRYTAKFEAHRYEEEHKVNCEVQPAQLQVGFTWPCACGFVHHSHHGAERCGNLPTSQTKLSWGDLHLCAECARELEEL